MPARLLNALSDENPGLPKQIGCMTGIFQMFDRYRLVTGSRSNVHKYRRRLPSDQHLLNNRRHGEEVTECSPRFMPEKNLSKSHNDNRRVSMESSRPSCSSSSCSSFSSLDCNKSTQEESSSFDRKYLSERSSKDPPPRLRGLVDDAKTIQHKPPNASIQSRHHSLDIRDVVKDSIRRDTRALSAKSSIKDEVTNHAFEHIDSPRPVLQRKSKDRTYIIGMDGKSRMLMDLDESLRVLVKLREAPRNYLEVNGQSKLSCEAKDASSYPLSRETSRLSYDGREFSSRLSLDSREVCSPATKFKELPRLSLDSREVSLRSSNRKPKLNSVVKDLDRTKANQEVSITSTLNQDSARRNRPPSIVAKLMGLEGLPNLGSLAAQAPSTNNCCDPSSGVEVKKPSVKSSKTVQDSRYEPPKSFLKDSSTSPLRNCHPVVKPNSSTRIAIEAAPWRHQDRVHSPRETTSICQELCIKKQTESGYGGGERSLKELRFQQSKNDLKALKQVLDTMNAKRLSDPKAINHQALTRDEQNFRSANVQKSIAKGSGSPRALESPIVIMKPPNHINKSTVSSPTSIQLEGLSRLRKVKTSNTANRNKGSENGSSRMIEDKSNRRTEEHSSPKTQSPVQRGLSRLQQSVNGDCGSSPKSSTSLSPRLRQRKVVAEIKTHPLAPPAELNKPRRMSVNRQPSESVSPRGKFRLKPSNTQQTDDHVNGVTGEMNFKQQADETLRRSDSIMSSTSQIDVETTSSDQFVEKTCTLFQQGIQSLSSRATDDAALALKQKLQKPSSIQNEDVSVKELVTVVPEHPSPVSVLDASFYQDDLSPSPVRRKVISFQDDEPHPSDDCSNPAVLNDTPPSLVGTEINRNELENNENLVQKLGQLSKNKDEPFIPDNVALSCDTQNSDHQYVAEILVASGLLLKDLSFGPMRSMHIQLHPSGHPINPDLFLVLEQTKSGGFSKPEPIQENAPQSLPDLEKCHRKLVFDVVNEILVQKMELKSPGLHPDFLLQTRKLRGQLCLRELCLEIEQIQPASCKASSFDDHCNLILQKDMLGRSEGWKGFTTELPGVVSEIEKLIFNDLIDDLVGSEAESDLQEKPCSRRRQLVFKRPH